MKFRLFLLFVLIDVSIKPALCEQVMSNGEGGRLWLFPIPSNVRQDLPPGTKHAATVEDKR